MSDPGQRYGSQAYVMNPDDGGLIHCAPKRNAANGPIALTRPVASRINTALPAKPFNPARGPYPLFLTVSSTFHK